MKLLTIMEFIGHFHPALVHLPIGILVIALLLHWLSEKEKYRILRPAIAWIYGAGFGTAFFSCVSGYMLSLSDDYDPATVTIHMWLAIVTTLVSGFLFYQVKRERFDTTTRWVSFALAVVIVLTGHLGGTLTHGSGYLSLAVLSGDAGSGFKRKPVPNAQEAALYNDLVQPLLHEKCFGCHGKSKRKGGLRMDDTDALLKGGKDGVVLIPSDPDHSELWKRLMLPAEDDDHMPPKEKPQLNENETALLRWWIENGAPFEKIVRDIPQDPKTKTMLASFEQDDHTPLFNTDIPQEAVARLDQKVIDSLGLLGIRVMPVAQNSNYVELTIPYDQDIPTAFANLLPLVKDQLVSLKAGYSKIGNEDLGKISACKNLIRLELQHTRVSDRVFESLKDLPALKYLNLVGTGITYQGAVLLKDAPSLQKLYLYQANLSGAEWNKLSAQLPNTIIDSGGYQVSTLKADTTVFKKEAYQ